MIAKILGAILVVATCLCIGWLYMEKENDRINLLKEFRKMCMLLKGIIRHGGQDLYEAISDVRGKLDIRIKDFMDDILLEMKKMDGKLFNKIWEEKVCSNFDNNNFKEKDRELIIKIGGILGYLDKELQIEHFEQYINEFNSVISDLEKEIRDKYKLYKTVSVGVALFIIIIFF